MVVITAMATIDVARRDEAARKGQELVAKTRQEPGCVNYVFYFPPSDPGTVFFFQQWETQDTFEAHTKAAHTRAFRCELEGWLVKPINTRRFAGESSLVL